MSEKTSCPRDPSWSCGCWDNGIGCRPEGFGESFEEGQKRRDRELRSLLYGWLGDRSSQPDGDIWTHEQLMPAARDLAKLIRQEDTA